MRSIREAYNKSKEIYELGGVPALVGINGEKGSLDYLGKLRYKQYRDGVLIYNSTKNENISVIYGVSRYVVVNVLQGKIHEDLINWNPDKDYINTYNGFRAIEISYNRCMKNHNELIDKSLNIDEKIESNEDITDTMEEIETLFHNFVASIYSFTETFDDNKSAVGELHRNHNNAYNKWEYKHAAEILGLRHYIQHTADIPVSLFYKNRNRAIPVVFYNEVLNKSYTWYGKKHDHTGKEYDGETYYFGNRDGEFFEIIDQCGRCMENLEDLFKDIKEEFEETLLDEGKEEFKTLDKVLYLDDMDFDDHSPSQ